MFREGFAKLGELGLSFDAWLYHPQLEDLIDLARSFPDQPIVLNHVGGPLGLSWWAARRDEVFTAWKASIEALSKYEAARLHLIFHWGRANLTGT